MLSIKLVMLAWTKFIYNAMTSSKFIYDIMISSEKRILCCIYDIMISSLIAFMIDARRATCPDHCHGVYIDLTPFEITYWTGVELRYWVACWLVLASNSGKMKTQYRSVFELYDPLLVLSYTSTLNCDHYSE